MKKHIFLIYHEMIKGLDGVDHVFVVVVVVVVVAAAFDTHDKRRLKRTPTHQKAVSGKQIRTFRASAMVLVQPAIREELSVNAKLNNSQSGKVYDAFRNTFSAATLQQHFTNRMFGNLRNKSFDLTSSLYLVEKI